MDIQMDRNIISQLKKRETTGRMRGDVFEVVGLELGKTEAQWEEARRFATEMGALLPRPITKAIARDIYKSIEDAAAISTRYNARAAQLGLGGEGKGGRSGKLKLLELFKGTGSIGKAAKKFNLDVVSVDLDPIYTPDIETDILKWKYKAWAKEHNYVPDLIWASPPCNTYSPLAYPLKERDTKTAEPKSDRARLGTKILYRTIEIISYFKKLNPDLLFVMENPRGMMRNDPKVKRLPHMDTTLYCLYNDVRYKPTDFFNNVGPDGLNLKPPVKANCKDTVGVVELPLDKRYAIPQKLAKDILKKMIERYKKRGVE